MFNLKSKIVYRSRQISKYFLRQKLLRFGISDIFVEGFIKWVQSKKEGNMPSSLKQHFVTSMGDKYRLKSLVETGTYLGEMVQAQIPYFDKIISIELSDDLAAKAKIKFTNENKVLIVHGDSGKELNKVLETVSQPSIFWLDGHYSEGITALGEKVTPIFDELIAIFRGKKLNHVLLIDDARLFNGSDGYPTFKELEKFLIKQWPKSMITSRFDIIIVELVW